MMYGDKKMKKIIEVEEALKLAIVKEVESGRYSQMEAAKIYGVSRTSIRKWLINYGKLRQETQIVKVVMEDQKDKIKELESALSDAYLEIRLYKKMIEISKRDFGFDVKKKLGSVQLENLRKETYK